MTSVLPCEPKDQEGGHWLWVPGVCATPDNFEQDDSTFLLSNGKTPSPFAVTQATPLCVNMLNDL